MQNFDAGGFILKTRHTVRREPQLSPELQNMLAIAKHLIMVANTDLTVSNLVFPMAETKKGVKYRQFVADPKLHNLGFIGDSEWFKRQHEYDLYEKPVDFIGRVFSDCKVVIDEDKKFYRLLNNGKRETVTPVELKMLFYKDILEMQCKYHVWSQMALDKKWEDIKASRYKKHTKNC